MRRFAVLIGLPAAALVAFFAGCQGPTPVTYTGGSEVVGRLVDSTNSPVANATVVVKKAGDTVTIVKTATSRADGTFSTDTIPIGTYNLFASKNISGGQIVAFIPDVYVDSLAPRGERAVVVDVGTRVMRPPGSIAGRVVLSYADPGTMAGIFVYIPGTSYIAMTNDTGGYRITGVPPGAYDVYYKSTGVPAYSPAAVTGITVVSNRDTRLAPDTLDLNTDGPPPAPRGVTASYDTARGIVTLRWRHMPLADLSEYRVLTADKGIFRFDTITVAAPDTIFIDTVFSSTSADTAAITRVYQVGAIDSSGNASALSEPPLQVLVIPPSLRPQAVQIVAADSTDSSVTLRWNRSPDAEFAQYRVYRREQVMRTKDSLIFSSSRAADTVFTFSTWSNIAADYWVVVFNIAGFSAAGTPISKAIRNTPPQFVTTLDSLPDSVLAGTTYEIMLRAQDKNNDTLVYGACSTADGVIDGARFAWEPGIEQAGAQRCTLTVCDTLGGADTIVWQVRVAVHGVWTDLDRDTLLGARRLCGITVLNGSIYAVGGVVDKFDGTRSQLSALKTVERYDSTAKKWVAAAPLAAARYAPFVTAANGKLYALGGFSERTYDTIRSIEEYNPSTNAWTYVGPRMPFSRAHGGMCAIGNRLYCIGGSTYDAASESVVIVKSIDIYDIQAKTWSKGPDLITARADMQAVVFGNKIYIIGGIGNATDSTSDGDALADIEVYDPNANTCSPAGFLNSPRCNFAAALHDGSIYVIGGITSLVALNKITTVMEKVSLPSLQIQESTADVEARHSHQAAALGNRIYCIGGAVSEDKITRNRTAVFYP